MSASCLAPLLRNPGGQRINARFGKCSLCSASRNPKRHRRRRGKVPRPLSKKDRIRALEPKPVAPLVKVPSLNTVESRLTQAQEYVYSFWGTRKREGPVMDGRWWFWNILLVSMPGTLLALYCEFVAKPEMHRILRELDAEQRARILGEDLLEAQEVAVTEDVLEEDSQETEVQVVEDGSEGEVSLIALKRRLDLLEAELKRKDRKLDHLRKYQLERSQQSGIQNRVEDRMIDGWKSDQKASEVIKEDDATTSLTERMKTAVMHGISENMLAKKEGLQRYGRELMNRARGIVFGEDETPSSPVAPREPNTSSEDESSNEKVVVAVQGAASHTTHASEVVLSSVSSKDSNDLARAAGEAAAAATEAARSAQKAVDAVQESDSSDGDKDGFLARNWKSWFRKDRSQQGRDGDPKPQA